MHILRGLNGVSELFVRVSLFSCSLLPPALPVPSSTIQVKKGSEPCTKGTRASRTCGPPLSIGRNREGEETFWISTMVVLYDEFQTDEKKDFFIFSSSSFQGLPMLFFWFSSCLFFLW
ncbi:hypothetical protein ANTQUA_LOCUS9198 [Anthophora quadrimaculata]